jgi:hypothetical protein
MKKKISAEMRSDILARESRRSTSMASAKRRGRHAQVSADVVGRRADYIESNLKRAWNTLGPMLLAARTPADVAHALKCGATPYVGEFISPDWYELVLKILSERQFPKTQAAQIKFLATSVAGWGEISARRSRDVAQSERKKRRAQHRILRYEFYVECTCGYRGPSMNHACRECAAPIEWEGILALT